MSNGHNLLEMYEAIPRRGNAPTLWQFQFGQIGTVAVYVWGGGLEGGLEEAAGWLKDNGYVGFLSEPDYDEAAAGLGIEWPPDPESIYEDSLRVNYDAIKRAAKHRGAPIEVTDFESASIALDWLLALPGQPTKWAKEGPYSNLVPDETAVEEGVREQAEADMTYTESGWLTSEEWTVNELHLGDEFYALAWEASIDELAEDGDLSDDDLEEVNAFAAEHDIDAGWEMD